MTILALDGALGAFSAALDDGTRIRAASGGAQDALEHGLEHVAGLLREAGLELAQLDRIAVGLGPGSFTGLRIAIAFAKSLAYGANVPLVGVSSYDALEPPGTPPPVLTVVRGRAGVICARLRERAGERTACGPVGAVLAALAPRQTDPLALAGNTEDVLSEIAERGWTVRALPPRADVAAVAIAQLARRREPGANPHALAPDYGEAPAVTRPRSS